LSFISPFLFLPLWSFCGSDQPSKNSWAISTMEYLSEVAGSFSLQFLIWVSLERFFPPAELEYIWCQFWLRPTLITGRYGWHWIIIKIIKYDTYCNYFFVLKCHDSFTSQLKLSLSVLLFSTETFLSSLTVWYLYFFHLTRNVCTQSSAILEIFLLMH